MIHLTELFHKIYFTEETNSTKPFTGHIQHHGDWLFYGDKKLGLEVNPERAFDHLEDLIHRAETGDTREGHELTEKVDGGMSVIGGMDPDGNHFVGFKGIKGHSDPNAFRTEEQIREYAEKNNKPHYARNLIPLLRHLKNTKIMPGQVFQGDLVQTEQSPTGTARPNTIEYEIPENAELSFAPHSQHEITPDGNTVKVTNYVDTELLSGEGRHIPNLALDKRVKMDMKPEHVQNMKDNFKKARESFKPETSEFAKTIIDDKHLFQFLQQYSNHEARTTGKRDLQRFLDHVDVYMGKSSQRKLSSQRQTNLRKSLISSITSNAHHFKNLFDTHNYITDAATTFLVQGIHPISNQLGYKVAPGSPFKGPEGVVSSKREGNKEIQAKIVLQGETGFPGANAKNAEIRFGKVEQVQEEMTVGGAGVGMAGLGTDLTQDDIAVYPKQMLNYKRRTKRLSPTIGRLMKNLNIGQKDEPI